MKQNEHFHFLDWLRSLATWLVVYDHLVAIYTEKRGIPLDFVHFIKSNVTGPLGIIQDFGWLGVSVFFLISGFIITHVSQRETAIEFIIKRVFRIFPLLILAICISVLLLPDVQEKLTLGNFFSNIFLINYFSAPQIVLLGVGWTLAIEVVFYLFVLAFMRLKYSPFKLIFLQLCLVSAIIYVSRQYGANFFLFSATTAYVPYLIFGSIFYHLFHSKQLSKMSSLFLFLFCYYAALTGISSIHTTFLALNNSYLGNFILSFLIFTMAFTLNDQLKKNNVAKFFANTSYIIYLIHGTIGIYLLNMLTPIFGFIISLSLTIPLLIFISWVMYKYLDTPILGFSRQVLKWLKSEKT